MAVKFFRRTVTVHTEELESENFLGALKTAIDTAIGLGATDLEIEYQQGKFIATFYRPQTDEEYADHVLTNTLSDEQREALKLKYNIEV